MWRQAGAVMAILLAGPCLGEEAGQVTAAFAWNSIELSNLEMGNGQEAYVRERIVLMTDETKGPLAALRGRCVILGVKDRETGRLEASGVCVQVDGDGDQLVLRVTESVENRHTLIEGVGTWAGGTGKFADASGEIRYSLVSFGLQPPGRGEGTGRLYGTLATGGE